MKKTIAEQLNIKEFPFVIKDSNGNQIYWEDSNGYWWKEEYDTSGKQIYWEGSSGDWWKRQYDADGNQIYFEDSKSVIRDNRQASVELTLDEVANKFGIDVKNLKIKK